MADLLNFNDFLNEEFNFDEIDKKRLEKSISTVTSALGKATTGSDEHIRLTKKLAGLNAQLSEITGVDEKKNWIADATKNKGALHKKMHVPEGEKIPVSKINKKLSTLRKKKSKTPAELKLQKELNLAKTLKKINK